MDVQHIQRNWRKEFFDPLAETEELTDEQAATIRYEMGKEVEWIIRVPDPEQMVQIRLNKVNQLESFYAQDIMEVDPFYSFRRAFFEYALGQL